MKVTIDRFEGDFAVVELPDGSICNLPMILIPDSKEGDIISIEVDNVATNSRKEYINDKAKKLWRK